MVSAFVFCQSSLILSVRPFQEEQPRSIWHSKRRKSIAGPKKWNCVPALFLHSDNHQTRVWLYGLQMRQKSMALNKKRKMLCRSLLDGVWTLLARQTVPVPRPVLIQRGLLQQSSWRSWARRQIENVMFGLGNCGRYDEIWKEAGRFDIWFQRTSDTLPIIISISFVFLCFRGWCGLPISGRTTSISLTLASQRSCYPHFTDFSL